MKRRKLSLCEKFMVQRALQYDLPNGIPSGYTRETWEDELRSRKNAGDHERRMVAAAEAAVEARYRQPQLISEENN